MFNSVGRFFRLRPGEYRLVSVMGLLLFTNSLALEISDVVAISGFLQNVGVPELLIVYIVDMLLIILTAGLQSLIVDRFQRVSLLRWMSIAIAVRLSAAAPAVCDRLARLAELFPALFAQ